MGDPGFGELHVAVQRGMREIQCAGNFIEGEPPEKEQFDNLRFTFIEARKLVQGFVHQQDAGIWGSAENRRFIER